MSTNILRIFIAFSWPFIFAFTLHIHTMPRSDKRDSSYQGKIMGFVIEIFTVSNIGKKIFSMLRNIYIFCYHWNSFWIGFWFNRIRDKLLYACGYWICLPHIYTWYKTLKLNQINFIRLALIFRHLKSYEQEYLRLWW